MSFVPAEAIAQQVGCDGVEPGGKSLAGIEAGAVVVNAHKGFLREVGGVGFVVELPQEVMEESLAVAVHEGVQGDIVARVQAGHVLPILQVKVASHRAQV